MTSKADLTWIDDNAPFSKRFKDRYFSAQNGREETRAVFMAGNGLPERWHTGGHFHIAELGFGTGLNFFETLDQWNRTAWETGRLSFTSFERYPLSLDEIHRALANWPELLQLASPLLDQWPCRKLQIGTVELQLIFGDARLSLPQWPEKADAWYLDGFSPAKNPQLWDLDLLRDVFGHTKKNGTFSTYTAAGFVRRNLQEAGFEVQRVPGFGNKRERLQGRKSLA